MDSNSTVALRASELSYRRLFETAQDGILILDAETGRIADANPFIAQLLGFQQSEMLGKTVGELSPFKDILSNQAMLERLQRDGYVRYEDLPLETFDGRSIAVEFVSNVYQVGDTQVIQCNIRDITARKRGEQRLVLLNACIANLNDIVMVTEVAPSGVRGPQIVFVNAAFERLTGYTSAEALGQSPAFLQGPATDRAVLGEIRAALKAWRPIHRQLVNYAKDGSAHWVDIDLVPIFDSQRKCSHFVSIGRDITAQKQIEEQLLRKTTFFEAQVHSAIDGILIVDGDGNKILQNARFTELLNIPEDIAEEVDDTRQLQWVTGQTKFPEEFAQRVAELYAHPDEIAHDETEMLSGKILDRYSAPVIGRDGERYGRIWWLRDITDRKRAEEKILEQAAFLDEARDAILVRDLEGTVVFWNQGAERLYGWPSLEAVGRNISELFYVDPDQLAQMTRHTLTTGEWHGEVQQLTRNRKKITIEARCTLIRTQDGAPKAMLAIMTDITERKLLEAQFMRAQRMESIGTMAGGIAHDLNNILAPILMSIDILRSTSDESEKLEILDVVKGSAQRGADIVRQVLSFARGLDTEKVELEPLALLKDIEGIIKDTFPKDIRLRFSCPADAWVFLGDATQAHQILLNLCVNSRDAMPHGGQLTIDVENCWLDEQFVAMNRQAKVGRHVCFSVTDSGTGMTPEVVDKIFEPFFTTKSIHKGTGLGLSTVMAIAKSHDGLVNVYSEPGKGTTFKVYLPAAESEGRPLRVEEVSPPRGNGETVLIVDDEASIRAITSQTLEAFGYRVLTAPNGADAVAIYAETKDKIAVVLTDMMMPIMDGPATIQALMRINPRVRIIAVSGLNANASVTRASGVVVKHFLTKPYAASALLKTIRAVLDEP